LVRGVDLFASGCNFWQEELSKKKAQINERSLAVKAELSQVEPIVEDARLAVKGIKRQQLVELRALGNPPKMVKLTMESVCALFGETDLDWKHIRSIIMKDDFIANIVNFDTGSVSPEIHQRMTNSYIKSSEYNFEAADRASKACGPLVKWVQAQLKYADILERIGPLRRELAALERSANETESQAEKTNILVDSLEKSIAEYKEEYANLISESQQIKRSMTLVELKVTRSISLTESLASEQLRWRTESHTFNVCSWPFPPPPPH
jgi:dynein heavy chain 1